MPKFTFSVTYRDDNRDPVELDLPNLRAAWSEAVTACGETLEDIDGDFGEDDEWLISVADEHAQPLFELRCISRHFKSSPV